MKAVLNWIDDRTGIRRITREALFENIPGGARWRYVWGSCLTFAILVQFITGIMLWMFYSPSANSAWESVHHLQENVPGGDLLRGVHHWTSQFMHQLLEHLEAVERKQRQTEAKRAVAVFRLNRTIAALKEELNRLRKQYQVENFENP